jgi:hypothetical protein
MPVRQMKLPFNAKPIARVVPSRVASASPQGGVVRGNKQASGRVLAKPILKVAGLPPPPAAEAPPAAGGD